MHVVLLAARPVALRDGTPLKRARTEPEPEAQAQRQRWLTSESFPVRGPLMNSSRDVDVCTGTSTQSTYCACIPASTTYTIDKNISLSRAKKGQRKRKERAKKEEMR